MIYSFLIRFFVVLGVIASLLIENVEYKSALIILSIIYLLFFAILVITSEGKKSLKYIYYAIDIAFLTFIIYVTGLTYLSNFVIPFFSEFIEGKEEYTYYGILSLIPVGSALFISNFSDYIFIPLILSGITAIYKVKRFYEEKEWFYKKLKSQMEKLYEENLKLQEEILENQEQMNILPTLQKILKEEISFREGLFEINEYFKAKGMFFIDFVNHKCIAIGDTDCYKEALAFVKDEIQLHYSKEIQELLNSKYIYSIVFNNKDDIVYGILFILFDNQVDIPEKILNIVKDYFDFYFTRFFAERMEEENQVEEETYNQEEKIEENKEEK